MSEQRLAAGRPRVIALLLAAVIGLVLGLIAAWGIWPVHWVDTDPVDLRPAHKTSYLLMVADSFAVNDDLSLAQARLLELSRDGRDLSDVALLAEATINERRAQGDLAAVSRLERLYTESGLAAYAPAPSDEAPTLPPSDSLTVDASLPTWVVVIFASGVALIALAAVAGMVMGRTSKRTATEPEFPVFDQGLTPLDEEEPSSPQISRSPVTAHKPSLEEILGIQEGLSRLSRQAAALEQQDDQSSSSSESTDDASATLAEPEGGADLDAQVSDRSLLTEFDVVYQHGNDDFYHSVTIDTPEETFIGQCGIVISDVLDSNATQHVDAFDIWLFETRGTRTVSKVLLSPWAATDEDTVARLSHKGDTMVVRLDEKVQLETSSLRLTAEIRRLSFEPDELRPNAIFQELALHMQVEQLPG